MKIFADLQFELEKYTALLQQAVEQEDIEQALQLAESRQLLIDELASFVDNKLFREDVIHLAEKLALVDDEICKYIQDEKSEVESKLIKLSNVSLAIRKYTSHV